MRRGFGSSHSDVSMEEVSVLRGEGSGGDCGGRGEGEGGVQHQRARANRGRSRRRHAPCAGSGSETELQLPGTLRACPVYPAAEGILFFARQSVVVMTPESLACPLLSNNNLSGLSSEITAAGAQGNVYSPARTSENELMRKILTRFHCFPRLEFSFFLRLPLEILGILWF